MNEREVIALRTSFFAIPPEYVSELTEAFGKWNSFYFGDELDDSAVVQNAIYRRASAVAVHQVDFSGKRARSGASRVVMFFKNIVWGERDRDVFTPAECRELAPAIDAAIERRGGEEPVMQLLARRSLVWEIPADEMLTYYRSFRDALDRAIEHGCGFTYATYEDGAEDRFAEAKAAFEELQRQLEWDRLHPPPPPTPEERARLDEIRAQDEAWEEERRARFEADSRNPDIAAAFIEDRSRHFAAVPATFMEEICALDAAAQARANHGARRRLLGQARSQAYEEARELTKIETRGERSAFAVLCERLEQHRPGTIRERGIYSPAKTRVLDAALTSLRAHAGGRQALVAEITRAAYGHKERFTVSMFAALERALDCAVSIDGGFVHWHVQV